MAKISVGKHFRSIKRATLRMSRRRINPVVALRLIGRSSWRIAHAVIVLGVMLLLAMIVLLIMLSGAVLRKVRGGDDIVRSKVG